MDAITHTAEKEPIEVTEGHKDDDKYWNSEHHYIESGCYGSSPTIPSWFFSERKDETSHENVKKA